MHMGGEVYTVCIRGEKRVQCAYTGQKDDSHPCMTEWDGERFHHATQNIVQFKPVNCLFLEFSI